MFPDTANFTDPGYTGGDPTADPLTGDSILNDDFAPQTYGEDGTPITLQTNYSNESVAGVSANSPAQSGGSGSSLLGWFGLASSVASAAAGASRTGYTTRPGVVKPVASKTSSTTILLLIIGIFVAVILLLRK